MTLLRVTDLRVGHAVQGISFDMSPGQRLGIIGESGSGKTLTAKSIMQLQAHTGTVELAGTHLEALSERQLCGIRGKQMAMVFQEPMTSLDPLMRVGKQVEEAIRVHSGRAGISERSKALFEDVDLDPSLRSRYPHQLSGGQRQRVLIAMALAHNPKLLICDEPTTALDATTQQAIVDLIVRLAEERGAGLLFITHDLGLAARTCQRVLVMRHGEVVERGDIADVLDNPQHEYTRKLVEASRLRPAAQSATGELLVRLASVSKRYKERTVVDVASLELRRGQRLGIVGGSGSGKTTLLKMIAGLTSPDAGSIVVQGSTRMVFQDPMSSLDPRMTIEQILKEAQPSANFTAALEEVGLDASALNKYPHQFSGGQRQRISIARALLGEPTVLLADEPVSALDVSVRAQVLTLLSNLIEQRNLTMVFVSHDLAVVRSVCDSIAVMHNGRIVEQGPAEILHQPQHPYTQRLLAAVPALEREEADREERR